MSFLIEEEFNKVDFFIIIIIIIIIIVIIIIYFCFHYDSSLNILPSMKCRDLLAACFIYLSMFLFISLSIILWLRFCESRQIYN